MDPTLLLKGSPPAHSRGLFPSDLNSCCGNSEKSPFTGKSCWEGSIARCLPSLGRRTFSPVCHLHEDGTEKQAPIISVSCIYKAVMAIRTSMLEFLWQCISDGRALKLFFPPSLSRWLEGMKCMPRNLLRWYSLTLYLILSMSDFSLGSSFFTCSCGVGEAHFLFFFRHDLYLLVTFLQGECLKRHESFGYQQFLTPRPEPHGAWAGYKSN